MNPHFFTAPFYFIYHIIKAERRRCVMDIDDIYLAGKNAAYDSAAKKLLASRKILGNADSIAESDFIWIFIHSVVDILLK